MPKIRYTYQQNAILECYGTLSVPGEIIAQGDAAVLEYIRENEVSAISSDCDILEYLDEVPNTMEFEDYL